VDTIYEIPLILEAAGLGDYLIDRLGLPARAPTWGDWKDLIERFRAPKRTIRIGVIGKYVDLRDAYLSVREALTHSALHHDRELEIDWMNSERITEENRDSLLSHLNGIVVPGGFGSRGIPGKILAAGYAREHKVPYLGLCLGLQVMTVELARSVGGLADANSTEFDENTRNPVIDLMNYQRGV